MKTIDEIMLLVDAYADSASSPNTGEHSDSTRAAVVAALLDMAKDAERYRWIQSQHWTDHTLTVVKPRDVQLGAQTYSTSLLDTAIDAAMKETK